MHKETLEHVENALPTRKGLDVEIFGMEGMPQEILDQHRTRIIQNFYQAQEDRRLATGNPLPGQGVKDSRKKIKIETAEELLKRLAEYRALRKAIEANGGAMEGVISTGEAASAYVRDNTSKDDHALTDSQNPKAQASPSHAQSSYSYAQPSDLPARPPGSLPTTMSNLPPRPQGGFWADSTAPAQTDDIDQMIRMAEAGIRPPTKDAAEDADKKGGKKDKDKKGKMVYDDAEFSPEERIAALPRYAFQPEVVA